MVKKLLAIISVVAMLATFVPCAYAEGEYTVLVNESSPNVQTKWTSGFNAPSGVSGDIYGVVVVDFKAKKTTSNVVGVQIRPKKNGWDNEVYCLINYKGSAAKYWRFVIDYATGTKTDKSVYMYSSTTGWNSMTYEGKVYFDSATASSVTIDNKGSVNSTSNIEGDGGFYQPKILASSVEELYIYYNGSAPTATDYSVTEEDGVYTANYTYGDDAGETEGATTIQWESSADGSVYTAIEGATEATYTPAADFAGYLRAVITPKSSRYPVEGTAVTTDAVHIVPELALSSDTGVYSAALNLIGLDDSTELWGVLAVYDGAELVEAVLKKDITVTGGTASFTVTGTEQVSNLASPSAKFFLWEAGTLVPVRTFDD